jgi:hypothetical protein
MFCLTGDAEETEERGRTQCGQKEGGSCGGGSLRCHVLREGSVILFINSLVVTRRFIPFFLLLYSLSYLILNRDGRGERDPKCVIDP